RLAHLLEDRQEPGTVVGGPGTLLQQLGQGSADDQPHHQERPTVGAGADLIHRGDAGVLELAGDARLRGETPRRRPGGSELALEGFHGDVAAQRPVAGAVDDSHSPVAYVGDELVPRRGGTDAGRRARQVPGAGEGEGVGAGGEVTGAAVAAGPGGWLREER